MLYEKGPLALKQIFHEILWALMTYRYDRAEFMIDGLDMLSRGPRALREARADLLHKSLIERPQVRLSDVSAVLVPDRLHEGHKQTAIQVVESKLHFLRDLPRRWLGRLTFNGHLLPLWFFKSAREPSFPGWIVESLHSQNLARIFRSRKVIYYEPSSGKGLHCGVDHGRFWKLFTRLCWRRLALGLRWRSLRDAWRADMPLMTSPEFWRGYLGLDGNSPKA
jgi:hypothetical protein